MEERKGGKEDELGVQHAIEECEELMPLKNVGNSCDLFPTCCVRICHLNPFCNLCLFADLFIIENLEMLLKSNF